MHRFAARDDLFWERFTSSRAMRGTAVLLVGAIFVVGCGREGAASRAIDSALNYDSRPGDASRPDTPSMALHASATELGGLLELQAKRNLSAGESQRQVEAVQRLSSDVDAVERQFAKDRATLTSLDATDSLGRLRTVEDRTAKVVRALQSALRKVAKDGTRDPSGARRARELLTSLSPDEAAPPRSAEIGFGTKSPSRIPASMDSGVTPAYGAPLPNVPASSLPRTPTSDDLAATPETKITAAIHDLAAQLGHDPVRIFEYVHNTIKYEPYFGARKGAGSTLDQRAGSDADQAALLVALLRDSGVQARFIEGVAELDADSAANWLGVDPAAGDKLEAAPDILASGGVPVTGVRVNGTVAKVRFNHVWAEAYVSRDAYRGIAEGAGGKAWLALDPSFKHNDISKANASVVAAMKPAADAFASSIATQSQMVGSDGFVAPTSSQIDADLSDLRAAASDILEDRGFKDGDSPVALFGGTRVRSENQTYLPSSMPFATRAVLAERQALSDSMSASISISVSGGDPYSTPSSYDAADSRGLTYTARTSDLVGQRVTIGYAPASAEDAEIADVYHGAFNAPAYAVALVPVLRIGGTVVARGTQVVSTGYTQHLAITYRQPGLAADTVENALSVGSLSAFVLSAGTQPADKLQASIDGIGAQADGVNSGNVMTDAKGGEYLSTLGAYYFARNDAYNAVLTEAANVSRTRLLSGAIVATSNAVSYVAGFPVSVRFGGLYADVDEDVQSVVSKSGDRAAVGRYLRGAGMHASSSEAGIFSDALGGEAASTSEVLRRAAEDRIPILSVDARNFSRLDALLSASADVRDEIREAVGRGARVTVPSRSVTIGAWTGNGYVIDEGTSIQYRLTRGSNGGEKDGIDLKDWGDAFGQYLEWRYCWKAIGDLTQSAGWTLLALAAFLLISTTVFGGPEAVLAASIVGSAIIAFFLMVAAMKMRGGISNGFKCFGYE